MTKKLTSIATGIILLFMFSAGCSKSERQPVRVLSYNLRFNNPADGLNAWPYRKQHIAEMIMFYGVDILGVQEALHEQLVDLTSMLPAYSYVGKGRDDGDTLGEYSAIVYNTQRFDIHFSGTFWLSETPDAPSLGWDAACRRICTWAVVTDKLNGNDFAFFNTHFDHVGVMARKNSAHLLLRKVNAIAGDLPVIITGDFNMMPSDSALMSIASVYADTYLMPQMGHYGPVGTWNGFDYNSPLDTRIDYCFVDSSRVAVMRHAHIDDAFRQRFPSDHLPVLVELRIR